MKRIRQILFALICVCSSAHGQSEPQVPFDLEKFQPVLSQCRLHSPRTSNPIAVSNGNFGGYELPGRFYLGDDGATMVLATTTSDRDRSELRHNFNWPVTEQEVHYSARLRFAKLVPHQEDFWQRRRLNFVQIYVPGIPLGPVLLVRGDVNFDGTEDHLWATVQGGETHDLGPRPDGFFNLYIRVNGGILQIFINGELKAEDNLFRFAGEIAYFKTGAYHRGIRPHAVEFDSLSITAGPFNHPPVFTSNPIIKVDAIEEEAYSATITGDASDPENDPLTFSKVSGPAWLNIAPNGDLSGTPSSGDGGLNRWTVEVSDDDGNVDRATLEIVVDSGNAPSTVSRVSTLARLAYATFDTDTSDRDNNLTMALADGAVIDAGSGRFGGSVRFNGGSDRVTIDNHEDFNDGNPPYIERTVSLWFSVDSVSGRQMIFESGGSSRGFNIYLEDDTLYVGGWDSILDDSDTATWPGTWRSVRGVTPGQWHHVALVLNASGNPTAPTIGQFFAYLNGVEFDIGNSIGMQVWNHTNASAIGGVAGDSKYHDEGLEPSNMVGWIDDFVVWNRALSASEIATIASVLPIVTFDFGTGVDKTAYQEAGFTAASNSNFTITDRADDLRFRSTANNQTGGITRTFAGLGGGERKDFTVTAQYTLSDFHSWTSNGGRPGSILLFANSSSVDDINNTGLAVQVWCDQSQPYQKFRISSGINNTATVNETIQWNADERANFGNGNILEMTVDVTFSGTDSMLVEATLTRLNNGDSVTVSFSTDSASTFIGGEYFGFGGRFSNTYETDLNTFSIFPHGNNPPVADAGDDQTVAEIDGSGNTPVALDGSGSHDPDGIIFSYVWSVGGIQIATGPNPTVSLSAGTHLLTLTVIDNLGASHSDTVTITVTDSVQESFGNWISGFALEERAGFNDDYNNDGVPNGIKFFFGIDPTAPSRGLSVIAPAVASPHQFTFTHPMAEGLPADIHGAYHWSKDLATFHADGASDGDGTTVTFVRGEVLDGMVTVTATMHGTPTDRIFVVLAVTHLE